IDGGRDQQEHDEPLDEQTDLEEGLSALPVGDAEADAAEVGRTDEQTDERHDEAVDQATDHTGEGRADDDRDREVENVAARDEFLETAEHANFLRIVDTGVR